MDILMNAGKAIEPIDIKDKTSKSNEIESLTNILVRAREQRLWISCNGGAAETPKEIKEKMDSGLYSDYSHVFSYVDPQNILMKMRADLRSLIDIKEEVIEQFEERISQASSDDPEAALRYLTVGKTFRFSNYKEPAKYRKWSSGWTDFICGTDRKLGYSEDTDYILRASKAEKNYIICEIDAGGWGSEPESVKVKVSEILDKERLQMFYMDFNELKIKDAEAFYEFLNLGRNNECWELLQKECNK